MTFLGPQFRTPTLRVALAQLGIRGNLVCITAGWQEREGEIDELRSHVGANVRDLALYARAEEVFAADDELRTAHRQRQVRLGEMQELYRLRLGHAKDAARELLARDGDPVLLRPARRAALSALRQIDRQHLLAVEREHAQFRRRLRPQQRASIVPHLDAIRREIQRAAAILIAGGHVAVLLNRLRLFDVKRLAQGKPVIAWSAGAMAACENIVLFHDHPAEGARNAEVFDVGLGMLRGVVALPHAQSRLALHDATRVSLLARRFAPARCVTLDDGTALHWKSGELRHSANAWQLTRSGALDEVRAA
jgi:peptidase E